MAVGLLALVCAHGCSAHRRPQASPAKASHVTSSMGSTIEAHDPKLSAALLKLRLLPSAAQHRAAADEYRRLGVLDAAFDQLSAAIQLDPRDAAAYDGRARIWRDWGAPAMGMGDASRAVYYAPRSAAAHNTLGTLLAATDRREDARREFITAVALDPSASFAQANLATLDALVAATTAKR